MNVFILKYRLLSWLVSLQPFLSFCYCCHWLAPGGVSVQWPFTSVCVSDISPACFIHLCDGRHSARYRRCKCALRFHLRDTALLTIASDQTAALEACLSLLPKAEWTSVVWLPRLQKNLKTNFLTEDKIIKKRVIRT